MKLKVRSKSLWMIFCIFSAMAMVGSIAWGVVLSDSIGGMVWEDLNRNGVREAGENGIGGVTVKLYNSSATLITTYVTEADGHYYFREGSGSYQVQFVPPAGYVFSPQNTGSDSADSDPDPLTGYASVSVSGNYILDLDAGIYKPPGGSYQTTQVPAFTGWGLPLLFIMIVLSERLFSRRHRRKS